MEQTPESVLSTIAALLEKFGGRPGELEHDDAEQAFENIARIILFFLKMRNDKALSQLASGFNHIIAKQPALTDFLEKFSPEERTLLRTAFLEEFLSAHLNSFSSFNLDAILEDPAHNKWGDMLIHIFITAEEDGDNGDIGIDKIVANFSGTIPETTATMEEMVQAGLLHTKESGKYALTYLGRAAASVAYTRRHQA